MGEAEWKRGVEREKGERTLRGPVLEEADLLGEAEAHEVGDTHGAQHDGQEGERRRLLLEAPSVRLERQVSSVQQHAQHHTPPRDAMPAVQAGGYRSIAPPPRGPKPQDRETRETRKEQKTYQPHRLANDKHNRLVGDGARAREEEEGERDVEERDGRQDRAGGYQRHDCYCCAAGARLAGVLFCSDRGCSLRFGFGRGVRCGKGSRCFCLRAVEVSVSGQRSILMGRGWNCGSWVAVPGALVSRCAVG